MPELVVIHFIVDGRPGPYHTHLALEDVEELGKLIKTGFSEELSKGSHPGIFLDLEGRARVLTPGSPHQFLTVITVDAVVVIQSHGPELVEIEDATV
jgi:hypothetical protein